jgi:hypothetical protein
MPAMSSDPPYFGPPAFIPVRVHSGIFHSPPANLPFTEAALFSVERFRRRFVEFRACQGVNAAGVPAGPPAPAHPAAMSPCVERLLAMLPVGVHTPVAGSYSSSAESAKLRGNVHVNISESPKAVQIEYCAKRTQHIRPDRNARPIIVRKKRENYENNSSQSHYCN